MAGIGFQLKKLFYKRGVFINIPAYSAAAVVTIGPTVFCIIMIVALQFFINYSIGIGPDTDAMVILIIYCFAGSLIVASPFYLLQVRYIADALYVGERDYVLPSLYGGIAIAVPIGVVLFSIIMFISTVSIASKFFAVTLMALLIISWILVAYTAALKRFQNILKAFFVGIGALLLLAFVSLFFVPAHALLLVLVSCVIGFFIIDAMLMYFIRAEFTHRDGHIFRFLRYIDKFGMLSMIGFCNILGVFAHQVLMWFFSPLRMVTQAALIHAPRYDIPVFAAYFTVLFTQLNFVLTTETEFYKKYRSYFSTILYGGSLKDITMSRNEMKQTLVDEFQRISEIQAIISLIAILLGPPVLELVGFDKQMLNIYNVSCIGFFIFTMSYIFSTMLLYFDDRKGALMTAATFLIVSVVATLAVLPLGSAFVGLGMPIGAIAAFYVSYRRLKYYTDNIDSFVFCSQPIFLHEKRGFFTKLSEKLDAMFIREANQ